MSIFPRPVGPRAAFRDLGAFMRQRSREQVIGAMLAVLSTVIIVILFLVDPKVNTQPSETIIYADSWPANRTDAQIEADQKKDQAAREEAKKEKQRQFQKLANEFGIE